MAAPVDSTRAPEDKVYFPVKSGASLVKARPVFSHDNRTLFACSGCVVKVFSIESGQCVTELTAHKDYVTGIVLHPRNKLQLISCSLDKTLNIWDYSDGVLLRTIPIHSPAHGLYSVEGQTKVYALVQTANTLFEMVSIELDRQAREDRLTTLMTGCAPHHRQMTIGPQGKFCVSVLKRSMEVKVFNSMKVVKHRLEEGSEFTCVACHPGGNCVATGCADGKILLLFHYLDAEKAVKSQLHWHALPVLDLCFTAEGSYLLSGGHECVLVKWHQDSNYKDFLPRLGAPINHVICSQDNQLYATCHLENVVQVISSNFTIQQVYQGLTRAYNNPRGSARSFPAGMMYDARSEALVMNGKPGHLQFYSVHEDRQLYNLDIVCQNFISAENLDRPLVVTEVTCAAFLDDGSWLATVEYWNDGVITPEITLKFWQFDQEKQSYVLNTTVEWPHSETICTLKMRPISQTSSHDKRHMAVTTSADGKFKIWVLVDDTDIYRTNNKWMCESVGFYRDFEAGSAEFSDDGSLLAVVFESCITLWEPETNLLKHTLINNVFSDPVREVLFGRHGCSQYLLSTTDKTLTVWSIITCSILWTVDLSVACLAQDPLSDIIAIFTTERQLFVFRPSNPSPVFSHVGITESEIVSAAFIPHKKSIYRGTTLSWQDKSELYFMNADQELLTVSLNDNDRSVKTKQDVVTFEQNVPKSALSMLLSHHSNKTGSKVSLDQVTRQPSNKFIREIFSSACHVQPSVSSLCQPFIRSLMVKSKSSCSQNISDDEDDDEDDKPLYHSQTVSQDSGLDSDMDMEIPENHSAESKNTDQSEDDIEMEVKAKTDIDPDSLKSGKNKTKDIEKNKNEVREQKENENELEAIFAADFLWVAKKFKT
ncbi:WD repeat-containing protein 75-like [Mya arenaria]|uniref:WD repeat-containing protein 75-like n=1 Tax=Mya arenaria TaxID=6604 RepID=UPI0022E28629|nr:WD repeat-containing protein 75-like [Mya arenaria]